MVIIAALPSKMLEKACNVKALTTIGQDWKPKLLITKGYFSPYTTKEFHSG